jgi:hypothetical protein
MSIENPSGENTRRAAKRPRQRRKPFDLALYFSDNAAVTILF